MADIVIAADGVSKRFLSHTERATSLKERMVRRRRSSQEFYALKDVSIEVGHGTTVGLLGANGSGKSTLLKVLAGILRPTDGTVTTHGRIASLLELGAGFNGELTGRENVYLNASLLGLSRKETDGLFDSIVDFSEIEEFIDNPVKHYSSGMYVRLGFAVAVHVDPDILLVDEVLAVGDEHFQRKCMAKITQFQRDGRTILFVSHSRDLVERICDHGVVLDHGRVVYDGDPYFAAETLSNLLGTDRPDPGPDEATHVDTDLVLGEIVFTDKPGGGPVGEFGPGDPLTIDVNLHVGPSYLGDIDRVNVVAMGVGDIPVFTMAANRADLPREAGDWRLSFSLPECPPLKGRFVVALQLERSNGQPIAATRTHEAFGVSSPHKVGLIRVDYQVSASRDGRP